MSITVAIKTFERPLCLEKCLGSIREHYPDIPILVADDSREPSSGLMWQYKAVNAAPSGEFDIGLSAGRNALVQNCDTEFIFIVEDDMVFTAETDLEKLVLEMPEYDILGAQLLRPDGSLQSYEGWMTEREDGEGKLLVMYRFAIAETAPCEIICNCFLARTQTLNDVPWDEDLKIMEHEDYFWRAKKAGVRVGFSPQVRILHERGHRPEGYGEYRNRRVNHFQAIARAKHGWIDSTWVTM